MLLNDAATEAVYHAPNGILKAKLAGKLVIDMSTMRPDTMKSNGSAALQQGAGLCRMPGRRKPWARQRKASCSASSADQRRMSRWRCRSWSRLCRRIEHVGEVGAGSMMKLAVNLPLLVYWQALGEALTICKPLNLPADRLIDILSDTVRCADRHEGARPGHRQGTGRRAARRNRVRPECREKGSGLRGSIRRVDPCRASRSPQARWPATRRPKMRALAMPTQLPFPLAGSNARVNRSYLSLSSPP
jgi:hypothetical protein